MIKFPWLYFRTCVKDAGTSIKCVTRRVPYQAAIRLPCHVSRLSRIPISVRGEALYRTETQGRYLDCSIAQRDPSVTAGRDTLTL
jgi:hypothetical protein